MSTPHPRRNILDKMARVERCATRDRARVIFRGDRPPTKTVVLYGSVDVSCSPFGPMRLLRIARAWAWCFHDSSIREYHVRSVPASCRAKGAVMDAGASETGFDEAEWAYCAS